MEALRDTTILICGASGDLTSRKLLPALFRLKQRGYLPENYLIIGVARRPKSDEEFRQEALDSIKQAAPNGALASPDWKDFVPRLRYCQIDLETRSEYERLMTFVKSAETELGINGQRVVYLATAPNLFLGSVEGLSDAGFVPPRAERDRFRVVIEKPFGHDLATAQELTRNLAKYLGEDQIYRIDHYLGKETVQNVLLFRFGNSIFEPLFNRTHVDHVQITVAESQGIEGGRGPTYDKSGALRDVLQNHLLQLLCLVAMEPPALFRAKEIRDEKVKVLEALVGAQRGQSNNWFVSGQYASSAVKGERVRGYLEEDRIPSDSRTETFVAMEARIDNWRWAGVPFYLRTGKRMPMRVTEIAVQFKFPPLNLFHTVECEGDLCQLVEAQPNTLVFRIQPKEAITLTCSMKRPGLQYQIHPVKMDLNYEEAFQTGMPEAYERLLLDVIRGDSTLFTRGDEHEAAWKFLDPVIQHWQSSKQVPDLYPAGTWGPHSADQLINQSGRRWRDPSRDELLKG